MSDEKRFSNLSMNDYFFEINFLLKLEVKLVSAILNIILTIFRKKKILLLVVDLSLLSSGGFDERCTEGERDRCLVMERDWGRF